MTFNQPGCLQVVFFTESEFTKRDYDRLGIELMRESGVNVHVFDMSLIYFPELKRKQNFKFDGYHEVNSYCQFKVEFNEIDKNGYVFMLMPLTFKLLPYFIKIWGSSLKLVTLRLGVLPTISQYSGKKYLSMFDLIFRFRETLRAFEISFLNKITRVLRIREEASIFIYAGRKAEDDFSLYKKKVSTGSIDFNTYLLTPASNENKHIVFLDEYEPFHPDFDRLGVKKISPLEYFESLNSFFHLLENRYRVSVVIAAHPAADLTTYSDYFRGRKVFKSQTASLVRDSVGVVGHTSTAIQFAFLYKKPACFVITNEMSRGFREPIIAAYKKYGFHFYNISFEQDRQSADLTWDEKLANKYIDDFVISNGTPHVNTWERFVDFIKNGEELKR